MACISSYPPEAWAESESDVQRAFFAYVMRRFQCNPNARPWFSNCAMSQEVIESQLSFSLYLLVDLGQERPNLHVGTQGDCPIKTAGASEPVVVIPTWLVCAQSVITDMLADLLDCRLRIYTFLGPNTFIHALARKRVSSPREARRSQPVADQPRTSLWMRKAMRVPSCNACAKQSLIYTPCHL